MNGNKRYGNNNSNSHGTRIQQQQGGQNGHNQQNSKVSSWSEPQSEANATVGNMSPHQPRKHFKYHTMKHNNNNQQQQSPKFYNNKSPSTKDYQLASKQIEEQIITPPSSYQNQPKHEYEQSGDSATVPTSTAPPPAPSSTEGEQTVISEPSSTQQQQPGFASLLLQDQAVAVSATAASLQTTSHLGDSAILESGSALPKLTSEETNNLDSPQYALPQHNSAQQFQHHNIHYQYDQHVSMYASPSHSANQHHHQLTPDVLQQSAPDCISQNPVYHNAIYEYDYLSSGGIQQPQQQQSQIYVYHQSDYSGMPMQHGISSQGSPMVTSHGAVFGTPQQCQQQQQQTTMVNGPFYATYPTSIPSYIYEANGQYTPVSQQQQQTNASSNTTASATSANSNVMSSPQVSQTSVATMLASYQTPQQASHHAHLYMPPTSVASPQNDATTPCHGNNDQHATSEAPQLMSPQSSSQQQQQQMMHQMSSNGSSPYMMYNGSATAPHPLNPYLTPQSYQSPMASPAGYMMYHHLPPPLPHYQQIPMGSMQQTSSQNIMTSPPPPLSMPLLQAPSATPITSNMPPFTPTSARHQNSKYRYRTDRFTNNYNNSNNSYQKRNCNQKFGGASDYSSSPIMFSPSPSENQQLVYSPGNTTNTNSPAQQLCFDEAATASDDHHHGASMYPAMHSYYGSGQQQVPLPGPDGIVYDSNGIASYGDEFVDDNNNGDANGEGDDQLACNVCRGRRMCFCYFLKVRYYKFPSFFDLVDHQYKKWRTSMMKPKKA